MLVDVEKFRRILCLTLTERSKENVLMAIKLLEKREEVISAEPDYAASVSATPPSIPTNYNEQKTRAFNKISLEAAWDISQGLPSVLVGVIDTGIDQYNGNLSNRLAATTSGLHKDFSNGISPGNALIETINCAHGTAMASIIAANGNNVPGGIIGVNWNVSLVSLRVYDNNCYGPWSYTINAIDHATNKSIPILNASIIGVVPGLNNSVKTAISNYPGLFVTSAGNYGVDLYTTDYTPASFNLPNMITVGGMNEALTGRALASDFGNGSSYDENPTQSLRKVHLFAPGTKIPVTFHNSYKNESGTSVSTPLVTGVAALIKAHNAAISAREIKAVILKNVVKDNNFRDISSTGGYLNAHQTLVNTQTCVSQRNTCYIATFSSCSSQCTHQIVCNPSAVPPCVDLYDICVAQCAATLLVCDNQFSSCMGM
jgi:subtilisin family serine protease